MTKHFGKVMICMPVSWGPPPVPAVKEACASCGRRVWNSIASQKMAKEQKLKLMCIACVARSMPRDAKIDVEPSKAQLEELKAYFGGGESN